MKKLIGFTIGIGAGVCLLGFALVVEAVKIVQRAEEQLEADDMYDALWGDDADDYDDYVSGVRGPVPVEHTEWFDRMNRQYQSAFEQSPFGGLLITCTDL